MCRRFCAQLHLGLPSPFLENFADVFDHHLSEDYSVFPEYSSWGSIYLLVVPPSFFLIDGVESGIIRG